MPCEDAMHSDIEQLAREIAEMGKPELVSMLKELSCPFKMDFSDEYLASITLERLRHIALAAILHCQKATVGTSARG